MAHHHHGPRPVEIVVERKQSIEIDARTQVDPAMELTGRVLSDLQEAVNGNGNQSA